MRHPGLPLVSSNGKDIPVLFAGNTKASMTSVILKEAFQKMNELGIMQRGLDNNGITYHPAAVTDRNISRMGEDFLRQVNNTDSCWEVNLGASNGIEHWQLHDDRKQNGAFKSQLAASKSFFYIMSLMNENEKKNKAPGLHQESKAALGLSPEELRKRYKESSFLTSGQVFGHGNGCLGTEAQDEVLRRNEARWEKESAIVLRKKTKL